MYLTQKGVTEFIYEQSSLPFFHLLVCLSKPQISCSTSLVYKIVSFFVSAAHFHLL